MNQHVAYYLGVMNVNDPLGGTPHDATMRYDARLALDIARRDAQHDASQRERDARRVAYDVAMRDTPIGAALRTMRVPTSPTSGRVFAPKAPRPLRAPNMGTCDEHGKPWVGRFKCQRCDPTRNAWESRAPSLASHKAADPACHHPLVRCSHKW